MDTLPPELLSKILLYLPPMDRLESSLTCRRWVEAMTSSRLLHDVWLDIAGFEMEAARSVLVNSRRQYTRLVLSRADLSKFDSEFWANIGADLRVLELEGCSWSADVFYAILQRCTKLESLKIETFGQWYSIDAFAPPEGVCQDQLRESLSHLWHINLVFGITADILDLLLGLMSNVISIHLAYSPWDPEFLERLPSILRENQIIRTGTNCFLRGWINEVSKFVDGTLGTLEELRISAGELSEGDIDAILRCTTLRSLKLCHLRASSNPGNLEKLISNLPPDLEILELEAIHNFEFEDTVRLLELKKLRSLRMAPFHSSRFTHFAQSLHRLERMSTLVFLDLQGLDVDSGVMKRLGCLKNLRTLKLSACPDSECFKAIYENFRRLTELHLGSVENLTDADGSKLCGFKELRCLTFIRGNGFTDKTFKGGVGSRTMKSLCIYGCSIRDEGLMSLASHHNRLETLSLFSCRNVTSAGVLNLLRKEPRLKILYTDVDLPSGANLRDFCPRIRNH